VKSVLKAAHHQYVKRISEGEHPDTVLDALVESSLAELKSLSGK
jgi:DNA-directed RNA polymerase subunit N (RpoN/RPB10)